MSVVVDSNMDGLSSFSGNLFAVLVYYLEVGDDCVEVVIGNAVFVNCTGEMTIVFIYSFSKHLLNLSHILSCSV